MTPTLDSMLIVRLDPWTRANSECTTNVSFVVRQASNLVLPADLVPPHAPRYLAHPNSLIEVRRNLDNRSY